MDNVIALLAIIHTQIDNIKEINNRLLQKNIEIIKENKQDKPDAGSLAQITDVARLIIIVTVYIELFLSHIIIKMR